MRKLRILSTESLDNPELTEPLPEGGKLATVEKTEGVTEVSSTAEKEPVEGLIDAEAVADGEQAEALEAQFLVVEDLISSWKASGKLTGRMVQEAHAVMPELNLANGARTHDERYSLVMEGIISKAWSLIKAFWEQLVRIWNRVMQVVMHALEGDHYDLKIVSPGAAQAMSNWVAQSSAWFESELSHSPDLKSVANPLETSNLKQYFATSGGSKMTEMREQVRGVAHRAQPFIDDAQIFFGKIKTWYATQLKSVEGGGEMNKTADSSFGEEFEKFLTNHKEFVDAASKLDASFVGLRDKPRSGEEPTIKAICSNLNMVPDIMHLPAGLEKRFGIVSSDINKFINKALSDISRAAHAAENGDSNVKPEIYRQLGERLKSIGAVIRDMFLVFSHLRDMQTSVIDCGYTYIKELELGCRSLVTEMEKTSTLKTSGIRELTRKLKTVLDQYAEARKPYV